MKIHNLQSVSKTGREHENNASGVWLVAKDRCFQELLTTMARTMGVQAQAERPQKQTPHVTSLYRCCCCYKGTWRMPPYLARGAGDHHHAFTGVPEGRSDLQRIQKPGEERPRKNPVGQVLEPHQAETPAEMGSAGRQRPTRAAALVLRVLPLSGGPGQAHAAPKGAAFCRGCCLPGRGGTVYHIVVVFVPSVTAAIAAAAAAPTRVSGVVVARRDLDRGVDLVPVLSLPLLPVLLAQLLSPGGSCAPRARRRRR